MKYLFVLIFFLCFVFFDTGVGYTRTSPWWTHFTYQFQHAGRVHLLINSLAFIGMFRLLEKFVSRYLLSALVIVVGFVASLLSMYDVPTVGASADDRLARRYGYFFFQGGKDIMVKKKFGYCN